MRKPINKTVILDFVLSAPAANATLTQVVVPQMFLLPSICNEPCIIQEMTQCCCTTVFCSQSLCHSGRLPINDQAVPLKEMLGILEH